MKKIAFSRKAILRAIHAACVALFLLAAASEAHAQTFSAPFTNVSGTTYDTQPGTFTTGGFNGTSASYTLTIDSGTTLNTTSSSYGSGVQFYNAKTNIAVGGATFANNGTVHETLTNPGNGYYSAVALYGTASGGATALNTGTLSLSATGAIAAGLSFDNSNFGANTPAVTAQPFTLTNSGTISGTASGYGFGVHAKSAGTGNLAITNQQGGTIQGTSSANYAAGVWAHFAGGGSLSVDNAGTISATGHTKSTGIDALTTTGAITITNDSTGQFTLNNSTPTQQNYGINANSSSGAIDITNAGLISLTVNAPTAIAVNAQTTSASDLQVANTGTITVSANASIEGGINIKNEGTGNAVITNFSGGVVDVTTSGAGCTGLGAISATGTAIVTNNGTVQVGSTGSAYGIATTGGSTQVTNTGTIGATGTSGSSYGIYSAVAGNVTVANSNTIQATTTGGTASAIYLYTPTGTGTVTNSGALTATGSTDAYGIIANGFTGDSPSYNITNSAAIRVTCTGSSGYLNSDGIFIEGGQNSHLTNSGQITVTSTGSNTTADAISCSGGNVSVFNSGALSATSSGGGSYGIYAGGQAITISNNQTVASTSASGYARGIFARAIGDVDVTNSGSLTVSGSKLSSGIAGISITSNVALTNSGQITATASAYSASGLYAYVFSGNIAITNSGHVVATSQSGAYTASGIYSKAGTGTTTISNSGYAGGFNTNGGLGYGIDVDPTGPIVVTNTGTAIGTTAGIFLANAGTVNNYGLASGGTYSIQVPTGSTVNLDGASPVLGLLKGGVNDTSTSQLNFNLAIRGNHLAADEAALNAAIAQYDAAYTAANGNGANVDSEVVTINGVAYQWEDFLGIADNLVQGRFYGATPGYQGIGSAVDNFDPNSARGTAILAALDNLPESAVANALAQLSPKALQVFRNIAFDGASFTAANVNNHLANQRDGLTGFDTSGFSVNTPGVDPMLTQMRSHLLAFNPAPSDQGLLSDSTSALFGAFDPKDTKAMVNTQPVDPWSAFISGSVILANLDNTTSTIGDSDYTTGSVLAGVDYRLDDHFTVGALFNYAHTSATLDGNGSKATVDSYAPGIYGSYVNKGWYGNAMLMYGFNNNTDDRQVTIPGISGDNHGASDGGQLTSNLTGGYEFQRGPFKFGPVASLQYVHLTVGSFQEQGPTSLSIDRQEADSLRTQLGFEARYSANVPTCYGPLELTPHFQASWQHEYMDNSDGISSQFNGGAGGGSFVVQGQQPERDSAFLDLGLDAQVAKNVTLFIDYQTQAGQNDFFAQSAQGGVRIGF